MNSKHLPLLAALVAVVLWSAAFVGIRAAGRSFSPGPLALGRLALCSVRRRAGVRWGRGDRRRDVVAQRLAPGCDPLPRGGARLRDRDGRGETRTESDRRIAGHLDVLPCRRALLPSVRAPTGPGMARGAS